MALVVLLLLAVVAPAVDAVNSICTTGDYDEEKHSTHKKAINYAKDKINDFYNTNGQVHEDFPNGIEADKFLMHFQKYQPQTVIISSHGKSGAYIYLGHDDREYITPGYIMNNIYHGDGDNPGWQHAAAPFSAIVSASCDSAKDRDGAYDFMDAFSGHLYAWIFIGSPKANLVINHREFIEEYSYEITYGKSSYKRAWEEGVKAVTCWDSNVFKMRIVYQKDCTDKDHDSWYDKYRSIYRNENAGCTLTYEDKLELSFTRSFPYTSNGGYIVFHGVINNDETDWTSTAKIKIQVYRKINNIWTEVTAYTSTWDPISNHDSLAWSRYYGGSDICSVYLTPSFLTNTIGTGEILFKVSNLNDGESDSIYVDRFEFMEIGKW